MTKSKFNTWYLKRICKGILWICLGYVLFAFGWNSWTYINLRHSERPISQDWHHYTSSRFAANDAIFPEIKQSIQANDTLWISMFLWPYAIAPGANADLPDHDINFSEFLNKQNTTGLAFVDSINLNYKSNDFALYNTPVVQAGSNLTWYILPQTHGLPNNMLMWFIHTPWLQDLIVGSSYLTLQQIYSVAKLSSNHQKVVVINNGEATWIGSRNFNRVNWNNIDDMFEFRGDFAKIIYSNAAQNVVQLNPEAADINYASIHSADHVTSFSVDLLGAIQQPAARLLNSAEIKPSILFLIAHSKKIDVQISCFSDEDIIRALNEFLQRGGELRIIVDPNRYMFSLKLPAMPNVIPITELAPTAQVRIHNTHFQMHAKTALFTLENGNTVLMSGSANWTTGALERYAFADRDFLVVNDTKLNQAFMSNMEQNWQMSTPREQWKIDHPTIKRWISKFLLFVGINPW